MKTLKEFSYLAPQTVAESFVTTQVRNMATIGGNICRSCPSTDLVSPLLVFDAEVKLVGAGGERVMPLEGFFRGPGENVLDSEILTEIRVPPQRFIRNCF